MEGFLDGFWKALFELFFKIVAFAVVFAILCAMFGCVGRREVVSVPEVRIDTCYISKLERDIVYVELRDSISTKERNDTVTIEHWRWRDRWRERLVHDTIYKFRTDSIPYPVPTHEELTWWQQTRIHLGEVMLGILGLTCVIGILKLGKYLI